MKAVIFVCLAFFGVALAQQCGPNYHECPNGICIPESWLCDGDNDCGDGSDEASCGNTTTTTQSPSVPPCDGFLCPNGRCIPDSWVCDGDNDCGDGSDEVNCPTAPPCDGFTCPNGRCIPQSWVCDGDNDCGDFADERDCPCGPGEVRCPSGECIRQDYWCDADGICDCSDCSDEMHNCTMTAHKVGRVGHFKVRPAKLLKDYKA